MRRCVLVRVSCTTRKALTDIQLSGREASLVNAMSRETILRQYLDTLKGQYSHILIDCQPSLEMLTVNVLAANNRGHNPCPGRVPARFSSQCVLRSIASQIRYDSIP